ncbi:low molecular weight protein-tyrosine-phosphatase [Thioalkalivibrio sp. ALJT]|uniref:low molecular weight protein-tyrosine-phosphatase n=1 Tax=Thioalkalivibrio sp. ALJT TaxID=1158146 RepID=UPI0003771B31|nr:low molecular weight protein-tyrosine-phosphatase [Thioalkalivibrio sp. ALJT]
MSKIRVLMVCLGNICRSPMAHGVFEARVREQGLTGAIEVDSAGTAGYHIGAQADRRARQEARSRGYDLEHLRARRLEPEDFLEFDYILTMDDANFQNAERIRPENARAELLRFLDFAPHSGKTEVPDPYYGGDEGFAHVMDLVEMGADGLLNHIRARHGFPSRHTASLD